MTPAAMLARADAVLVDLDGTLVDSSAPVRRVWPRSSPWPRERGGNGPPARPRYFLRPLTAVLKVAPAVNFGALEALIFSV
jgi:FMN phosphatase YigB (HAD superfamily)